jgi:hypothetical protein
VNVVLTDLGAGVVRGFNALFVYARCTSCGLMGCPLRDGYKYNCPRLPACSGFMAEIEPETLRARFVGDA